MNARQKYQFRINISLFVFVGMLLHTINAQNWDFVHQIGGAGNENVVGLVADTDGDLLLTGTFTGDFIYDGDSFTNSGESDVFLLKTNESGDLLWKITGESQGNDETIPPIITESGDIFWAGMFWDSITFESTDFYTTNHGKGIFLLKLTDNQSISWGKTFSGTGLKTIVDIKEDNMGNVYLTGYFSDSLFVDQITLVSEGERDAFLIKLTPDGEIIWAQSIGLTGKVWTTTMEIDNEGNIILGGHFQGSITYAGDTITTATNDEDVFISKTDTDGNGHWIRGAGGVYDDICTSVAIDNNGDIYAAGGFTGVMMLSDELQISTLGYDDNFFLIKYSSAGQPQLARSIGGEGFDKIEHMAFCNGTLVVTGYFQGAFSVDDLLLDTEGGSYSGFAGGFDELLSAKWFIPFHTSGFVKGSEIECTESGEIFIGGSFTETVGIDDMQLSSNGGYDSFFGKLMRTIVTTESGKKKSTVSIFPNPVVDEIFINIHERNFNTAIFDVSGRCIYKGVNAKKIDVGRIAPGIYFGKIDTSEKKYFFRFMIAW